VLASDLDAFGRVLDGGERGVLFGVGDDAALAASLLRLLADEPLRHRLATKAQAAVRRYDWSVVADEVLAVYETVAAGAQAVAEDPQAGLFGRWRRPDHSG
jgi:phosphatidyl-myo-inositol alpha-mannosyltransferase